MPDSKNIGDVVKLLRENPEFGSTFHKHFEDKVFQLNRAGWSVGTEYADQKHLWGAQFIVAEILDEFNLYDLARK